jgi:segregation and condensation protein A
MNSDVTTGRDGHGDDWDVGTSRIRDDTYLTIDIDGFEGPLDLLLELARRQKVDLVKISVLALAEQYLAYIESARQLRIEVAADYLVMAAWLAYLKSRLLLPEPESDPDEPSGEEMAALLAFRLQRLEAMRQAGARLMNRNRLGRDFFARGNPEPTIVENRITHTATLYDLLSAYAAQRQKKLSQHVTIARREVWSLAEAREALLQFGLGSTDWATLESFLVQYLPDIGVKPEKRATVRASSFAATLELVREGRLAMRQAAAFAPLYLRAASPADAKTDERF